MLVRKPFQFLLTSIMWIIKDPFKFKHVLPQSITLYFILHAFVQKLLALHSKYIFEQFMHLRTGTETYDLGVTSGTWLWFICNRTFLVCVYKHLKVTITTLKEKCVFSVCMFNGTLCLQCIVCVCLYKIKHVSGQFTH